MRMNDTITVKREGKSVYDPELGKHLKAETSEEVIVCNVSVVRDYVEEVQQGKLSGKTIKVRLVQPIDTFQFALYNGKTYTPTEYVNSKNRMSITLEEVAYDW